jgi:hypothetical protein
MEKFRGAVKPYVRIDGLGLSIGFNEEVSLEGWQIQHKHFQFALRNGWVLAVDRQSVLYNSVENLNPHPTVVAMNKERQLQDAHKKEMLVQASSAINPSLLQQVLEKQTFFLKNVQQSYDSLKQEVKAPVKLDNQETNKLLQELVSHQKKLIDLIEKRKDDTSEKALGAVLAALKALQEVPVSPPVQQTAAVPSEIVELLKDIKSALANNKTQTVYNKETGVAEKKGFQIQDFEEKYVPKVEDLDVKSSKIVTQESVSHGTEDALAALKALKKKG